MKDSERISILERKTDDLQRGIDDLYHQQRGKTEKQVITFMTRCEICQKETLHLSNLGGEGATPSFNNYRASTSMIAYRVPKAIHTCLACGVVVFEELVAK